MEGLKRLGRAIVLLFVLSAVLSSSGGALVHQFSEDFSSKQYCDTLNTSAWWDTVGSEIKLFPFEISVAGSVYTPDEARGVVVSGDYAYVCDRLSGLQVIDISDPAVPTIAGSYDTPGFAYDVAISGDYAYVADNHTGLQVIDISDPLIPTFAGSYGTPSFAWRVAVSGDYAYVADRDSGLQVVDITDPTVPVFAGSYDTPSYPYGMAVSGNYAYMADYSSGLQVIDITDPTTPTSAGSYNTPGLAHGVAISGNYAYVADHISGLQVIDITNPTTPISAGSFDTPGLAYGVAVSGDHVYVADESSGLQVIDITDPAVPTLLGSFDTPGLALEVAVSGEHAYLADGAEGLRAMKVADVVLPPLPVGSYDTPGSAIRVDVCGDYAYVADWTSGLQVIDVADPTVPTLAGDYDTPGQAYDVAVSGDYAYVADWDSLMVIDVTDPTNPTREGSYGTADRARAVAVSGDYAYVADYSSGLQVIDISDPANPTLAGSYNTTGFAWGVAVSGDYAYVADMFSGLQVIDITDPAIPTLAGNYNTSGTAFGVDISGNYAYVADGDSGLVVIDITDPTAPVFAGGQGVPYAAFGVDISGDYAYVGGWQAGLEVHDISDPANPVWVESLEGGDAWGVTVSGGHAYIGNRSFGLQVMEVFERSLIVDSNSVQSLPILETNDEISAVRLTTVQTDSLYWYVSADSGASWDLVPADGGWYGLGSLGGELLWRTTLTCSSPGVSPTCSSLDVEWKYSMAEIDSVGDVPDDQGGWVRARFDRSGLDLGGGELGARARSYCVHRRVDDVVLVNRILEEGKREDDVRFVLGSSNDDISLPSSLGGARAYTLDGRYYFVSNAPVSNGFPAGAWEAVGTIPATQEEQYYCLAPSVADSGAVLEYTVFCVSTHTTDPEVYHFSPPDSGYSIDNLAPAMPQDVAGLYSYPPSELLITWSPNVEADLSHYAIYKGASPGFVPNVGNRLGEPVDTFFVDASFDPNVDNYYKVSALDIHWNESDFSLLGPGGISGVGETPPAPQVTMLEQNIPNPFNPVTVIRFSIARPGWVVLRIFDVTGRPVRTLVKGRREIDRYEVTWDGRDDGGRLVASGVYLYELDAPGYLETKKMVLVR
jgi:hypothetical protein